MRLYILLSAFACLFSAAPAAAKWREASSEHFVIYSQDGEQALRDFATRLERYDGAMRYLRRAHHPQPGRANRLTVYMVSDVDKVRRLAGAPKSSRVGGFYIPRASGPIAIIPGQIGDTGEASTERVLLHEYAHHILLTTYSAAVPAWFNEGFAEFTAGAQFDPDGTVALGLPALHRGPSLFAGRQLPIERLLSLGSGRLTPEERDAIYTRGWLLTHYLLMEPKREGQLDAYLRGLNGGKNSLDAATSAFGDLRKLNSDLQRYLRRGRMSYLEIGPAAINAGAVAMRELSAPEEAVMDLKIRSRRGVTRDQARALVPEVRRAAAPFPDDPAVQATLAEAEYDAGNYAEAEQAANRALAADGKSVDALLYKGRAKMAAAELAGSRDPAHWGEARRWLVAANRADPDDPEPLMLFYDSFRRAGMQPTPNSVVGLVRAYELAPQDRWLRMQVARQYLVDGKPAEARAALAPIAYDPHAGLAAQVAASIIAGIDRGGADLALKAWQVAETKAGGGS